MSARSTMAARRPSLAAAIAAFCPAGPDPMTRTSYSSTGPPCGAASYGALLTPRLTGTEWGMQRKQAATAVSRLGEVRERRGRVWAPGGHSGAARVLHAAHPPR